MDDEMNHAEYYAKLQGLRKEYGDAIRELATREKDNYTLISRVELESSEYRLRVSRLIQEYMSN